MNFTREPIIETVISPREGMKLLVRNSKGTGQEEYYVDAVEVVSFGHSLFFRSLERPKSFLVPVSDYEVLEFKEARVPLKNAMPERSIKIGGGREGKVGRESPPEDKEFLPESFGEHPRYERSPERSMDHKRDKRRRNRRNSRHEPSLSQHEAVPPEQGSAGQEDVVYQESGVEMERPPEEQKAPSFISKLFPPPPTLIKETLSRYKPAEAEEEEVIKSSEEETFDEDFFTDAQSTDLKTPPDDTEEKENEE